MRAQARFNEEWRIEKLTPLLPEGGVPNGRGGRKRMVRPIYYNDKNRSRLRGIFLLPPPPAGTPPSERRRVILPFFTNSTLHSSFFILHLTDKLSSMRPHVPLNVTLLPFKYPYYVLPLHPSSRWYTFMACPKNLKTCKRENYDTSYDSPCWLCQHSLLTLPRQLAYCNWSYELQECCALSHS